MLIVTGETKKLSNEMAKYVIQSDNAFVMCGVGVAYCIKVKYNIGEFKRHQIEGKLVGSKLYSEAFNYFGKTAIIGMDGNQLASANFAIEVEPEELSDSEAIKTLNEKKLRLNSMIEELNKYPSSLSTSEKVRLGDYLKALKNVNQTIDILKRGC
jgi:hypothetical protein